MSNKTTTDLGNGLTLTVTTYIHSSPSRCVDREGSNFSVYLDENNVPCAFEHHEMGDEWGGGLWFEGKTMSDYDGVGVLPKGVIKTVRALGFHVPRDFE